jgi:hypothetical protein
MTTRRVFGFISLASRCEAAQLLLCYRVVVADDGYQIAIRAQVSALRHGQRSLVSWNLSQGWLLHRGVFYQNHVDLFRIWRCFSIRG